VDSKDLIAELKRIKVVIKSASSSVEDKHVRKVMERFEKKKVEEAARKEKEEAERRIREKEEEERRKREEEERKKREDEERKRREEEERKRREEEARKRREEDERKRREEERKKREEEDRRRREEEEKPAPAVAAAPPKRERPKAPVPEEPAPARGRRARKRPVEEAKPLEIIELPKIEVMKLEDPRKLYAERARRRAKDRKRDRKGKVVEGEPEDVVATEVGAPEARKRARRIRPSFVVQPTARREAPLPAPPVVKPAEPRLVQLRGEVTVGQFAERIGVAASDVIAKMLSLGEPRTINQPLETDLCELLGPEFGVHVEIIPETDEYDLRRYQVEDRAEEMVRRPPVVTIMGHVDHGKTTLLDYIRKSRLVDGEFGGITQHIGAYRVSTPRGDVVFLDTPGHEAFTSMRARGASVTDIVVLVVAADDGVMPQTVEAIDHAQAAQVPIIVAVNKMDLPNTNPDRVRQELMRYNLVPEELGGQTIFVEVSAKFGQGIDHLLEMIAIQAEVLELRADPLRRAEGVVIEARVNPTRGAIATLLVQKGTLRVGDVLVIGRQSGRVRAMLDEYGRPVQRASPSMPMEVLGLGGSPEAGERFLVMPDERSARDVAAVRDDRRRQRLLGTFGLRQVTLENLHQLVEEGKVKEFRLILKGDVQGSIEAIAQALSRIISEKIKLRILHAAVGPVSESDVNLAKASEAVIIGFGIRPDPSAEALAEREGVEIKLYRIIYELIDDVQRAMTAALEPETREIPLGRAEVRQVFRITKVGIVAGCYVSEGEVRRDARIRLVRDGVVVYDGKVASLRRVKDDVEKVANGLECGIALANYSDIKEGDLLEAYKTEVVPVAL
jgi:translation initiation factor IF-2